MIEYVKGDIFASECEAITNTVNCVGAMGGGLALLFKRKFPQMYKEYIEVCNKGELRPGQMHIWENPEGKPKYIVNFPTKDDWVDPSETMYVIHGLVTLKKEILSRNIKSIAIPALGCGLGGLNWSEVRKFISNFELLLPETIKVVVYEPLE